MDEVFVWVVTGCGVHDCYPQAVFTNEEEADNYCLSRGGPTKGFHIDYLSLPKVMELPWQ